MQRKTDHGNGSRAHPSALSRPDPDRRSALQGAAPFAVDAAGPADGTFVNVLAGRLGAFASEKLRIRPRQVRAIESVGRILSAAAEMSFSGRSTRHISVEKIASEAGVTPQAAYRYFKDAGELIDTGLRCIAVCEHERVLDSLSKRLLSSESELAVAVVGIVIDARERIDLYPAHLHAALLREYRQVGNDASSMMSEIICANVDADDVRSSLEVVRLTVALTATIAVITSSRSRPKSPLRGSDFELMLINLFLTVLQSTGQSFNAFREIGETFRFYLDPEVG